MGVHFIPSGSVEVPEIPFKHSARLPADQTAVIVVDMQNDFVKESGSLVVPMAIDTVSSIQSLLESARQHDVRVTYTQDTQIEDDPEFDLWPVHCLAGTWGWRIIDELDPHSGEVVCPKNRYDGFYESVLDHFLTRVWRVNNLVIVGTLSNVCVLHTAASAGLRHFHIVVPADAISALTDFDQALTLRQVSWLYSGSVVRSVKDIRFEGG